MLLVFRALSYSKGKALDITEYRTAVNIIVQAVDFDRRPYEQRCYRPLHPLKQPALKTIAFVMDDQPALKKYEEMESKQVKVK
jgi:hypothetical protein